VIHDIDLRALESHDASDPVFMSARQLHQHAPAVARFGRRRRTPYTAGSASRTRVQHERTAHD
jgi:hypothetical protein